MPFVTVEMWEGRTQEQKKELVKGITAAFEKIGVPPSALQILIRDNAKSNWATGAKFASES
jgi:4-oxalocrotonate tautomerase